jgi:sulfane dehydrogenase subunit SoxC
MIRRSSPLGDTPGIITPSALHFEVHRSGVPDIDPRKHRLLIHGMVDRPVMLTMEEIRRLPSTSRILFVECGGNTLLEWRGPNAKTVQGTHGATSCSEWTGVTAYLLHLNGIVGEHDVLDARTLPRVRMPNRDGFVPDTRPDVGKKARRTH